MPPSQTPDVPRHDPTGIDAFKPAEVAKRIEEAGATKAGLHALPLTVLSVMAGIFIALGAAAFTAVVTGTDLAYGPTRFLGGLVFSLGLVLVVVAEVAARRVARRPQRSGSTDVLAADDALRATAISVCGGASLRASTSVVQVAALAAATGTSGVALLLLLPVQMLGFGALWCIVRQETWGYRPRHRQVQQVGAA